MLKKYKCLVSVEAEFEAEIPDGLEEWQMEDYVADHYSDEIDRTLENAQDYGWYNIALTIKVDGEE